MKRPTKTLVSVLLAGTLFLLMSCTYAEQTDNTIPQDCQLNDVTDNEETQASPGITAPEEYSDNDIPPEKIPPEYQPAPTPIYMHNGEFDPFLFFLVHYAEADAGIPFDEWWATHRVHVFPDEPLPSQLNLTMASDVYEAYTSSVSAVLRFSLVRPFYSKEWIQDAHMQLFRQVDDEWYTVLMAGRSAWMVSSPRGLTNNDVLRFTLHQDRLVNDYFTPGTYRLALDVNMWRTDGRERYHVDSHFGEVAILWSWSGLVWAEFTVA